MSGHLGTSGLRGLYACGGLEYTGRAHWHEGVRRELDGALTNRKFWLEVHVVAASTEDACLDGQALRDAVESWLRGLDPEADRRDAPPELKWQWGGVVVRLTARHKVPELRTADVPVVGNAEPGFAHFSG
jgi:hypothetical protein